MFSDSQSENIAAFICSLPFSTIQMKGKLKRRAARTQFRKIESQPLDTRRATQNDAKPRSQDHPKPGTSSAPEDQLNQAAEGTQGPSLRSPKPTETTPELEKNHTGNRIVNLQCLT